VVGVPGLLLWAHKSPTTLRNASLPLVDMMQPKSAAKRQRVEEMAEAIRLARAIKPSILRSWLI
jgi:hypothetical protein